MKKVLIALYILALGGCSKEEAPKDPVDSLPPITQTGENTFAYLINGEPFFTTRNERGADYVLNTLTIYGFNQSETGIILTGLEIKDAISEQQYSLQSRMEGKFSALYLERGGLDLRLKTTDQRPGRIIITRFDLNEFIVSGTFEFTVEDDSGNLYEITDGRFDFKL
jgi:hypothetical protein